MIIVAVAFYHQGFLPLMALGESSCTLAPATSRYRGPRVEGLFFGTGREVVTAASRHY